MPKLYRPNVAAIFVKDGKVLLVHKSVQKKRSWQFPQGGVHEGETAEQALRREVLEELGISDFKILYRARYEHQYDWPKSFLKQREFVKSSYIGQRQTFFVCESSQPVVLGEELEKFQWVPREKLLQIVRIPNLRKCIRALRAEKQGIF
ncbi:MAG: NUDIX domain-containing protein [Candidatus Diapherotrites archaeon]